MIFRFRNISVSKLFQFLDGFGIGIENFWFQKSIRIGIKKNCYKKKYRIRYRKKFRIRFRSDFGYCHTLESNDTLNKLWCHLWTVLYSSGTQVGKYKTKTMMVNQPTTTQINQEFRNKAPLWKVKNIKNRFLQKKIWSLQCCLFMAGIMEMEKCIISTLKLWNWNSWSKC